MLAVKALAVGALAALASVTLADDYDSGSYVYDEGSDYYDSGSYDYDDGSDYYESGSYEYDDGSDYYESGSYVYDGSDDYNPLPSFVYTFDPEYAAGVSGDIKVQYAGPFSTFVAITVDLDFSDVDMNEIMEFDGNCTEEVTEFKWHIHVKWPNDYDSESFKQCGLPITGNHYDPLLACSPNSEFVGTPDCLPKTPEYNCNPSDYAADPLVCEKGDLAGKFGDFSPDEYKKVSGTWTDPNYPQPSENTPEWNIILHAVCGKFTPRIACAVGKPGY